MKHKNEDTKPIWSFQPLNYNKVFFPSFSFFLCYWSSLNLYNFLISCIFSETDDSVILLGFECTINSQNLIKIVWAIFEKIEILNFFMWTTLNFKGLLKTENGLEIFERYQIWTKLASVHSMDSKLKNSFLVSWIFSEKPIVSYCWVSKVL